MKSGAIFIFSTLAVILVLLPMQHFMSLSRPQHYGLGLGILSLGYLLQTCLSWKKFGRWERACYLATGIFFASIGIVFLQNSWLDISNAVQTDEQLEQRKVILACYLFFALVMSGMWLTLIISNMKARAQRKLGKPG
jgi:hypothetical protein